MLVPEMIMPSQRHSVILPPTTLNHMVYFPYLKYFIFRATIRLVNTIHFLEVAANKSNKQERNKDKIALKLFCFTY